ncbi:hypothetical protein E2C01_002287 [Portunus trituberculatus]|uniref:Uncharacterized protein n=1 Tax=Portunus trituberculatus TaxID=210409 RepID=A0A5B7CLJ8_PORTR|nr:hypothetical protein [Portunus trituberculatus]
MSERGRPPCLLREYHEEVTTYKLLPVTALAESRGDGDVHRLYNCTMSITVGEFSVHPSCLRLLNLVDENLHLVATYSTAPKPLIYPTVICWVPIYSGKQLQCGFLRDESGLGAKLPPQY